MDTKDVLIGVGVGAALAFLADPESGRRRRALARNRVAGASRRSRETLGATVREVRHRAAGMVAATRSWSKDEAVDDDQLAERVRARLGHVASYPGALHVTAADGLVTLRGPIPASEVDAVLAAVQGVPGVTSVVDELDGFDPAGEAPDGRGAGEGRRAARTWRGWAPSAETLIAGLGLCSAALVAARKRR